MAILPNRPLAPDEPASAGPAAPPRLGGATKFAGEPQPAASETVLESTAELTAVDIPTAPADDEAVSAEQARLDRERLARREARMAALSPTRDDDAPAAIVAPPPAPKRVKATTDRWHGSLALFGLRLVTAAILAVHGLNGLLIQGPGIELWSNTVLPYPRYIAISVAAAEVAIAILLLFGLLTRLAGLLLLALMAGILTFVMWGTWSVFEPGGSGFIGEEELLLAATGLVFLLLGAGGWSLDRAFRSGREREGLGS